jgi:hypothetical protein
MSKSYFCDPPSGWRYGFPKKVPLDVISREKLLVDWLVEEGYPKEIITEFGNQFCCRFWYAEDTPEYILSKGCENE